MAVDPVSLAINAALIAANMAMSASQKFEGPRLDDLRVTTADYGTPLNYVYGIRRLDGVSCIWAEPLREVKRRRKTKGGKFNDYSYFGTWAVAVCDCEIAAVTRIWFDRNLIYDATGSGPVSPFSELGDITQFMRIYLGTDDQLPDPRMAATVDAEFGAGSTPAYRGVAYIVFEDLPLEKLGNRLPQVSVEAVTAGAATYPKDTRSTAGSATLTNGYGLTWSSDRARVYLGGDEFTNVWDVGSRSLMVEGELGSGTFDAVTYAPRATQRTFGVADRAGYLYYIGEAGFGSEVLMRTGLEAVGGGEVMQLDDVNAELPISERCLTLLQGSDETPELQSETTIVFTGSYVSGAWQFTPTPGVPERVSPIAPAWKPRSAFRTVGGTIRLIGGGTAGGVYAADECVISGYSGGVEHVITMPEAAVGLPPFGYTAPSVAAFHYVDEAEGLDQYVIGWKGITTDWLVIYDLNTSAITHQHSDVSLDPHYMWPEFESIVPGAASIWLYDEERSAVDGSLIQTYDITDWIPTAVGNLPVVYDRNLHALFVETNPALGYDFAWLYLDRMTGAGVTLRSIVEDVSTRAGLGASDIDAADLTQTVTGYSWSQGQGKQILDPLLEAYDSEARPHDFEIEFLRRGDAVGASIPVRDMGAGGGLRYTAPQVSETDLPLKVNMTFADIGSDQQPNTALAQRPGSATVSRREASLDAGTLALDVDESRQMADGYLRRTWIKAQTYELSLQRIYSDLEPGDARELVLDDVTVEAKLTRLEFGANGVLTTEWERYAPAIHTATTMGGADADGLIPDEVVVFGATKGLVLDIALITDAHDTTTPTVYLAAAPYSDDVAWPGATFYRGDDGVTYEDELGEVASSEAAIIGYAMSALPDALVTVWDRASSVSVKLFHGELESCTETEAANGANMALLGDEIIHFTTATLVATDTYQLSGFLRGRRGSEWASADHAAGEAFVLLAGTPRASFGASDVGDTIYTRPTTNGGLDGFPQTLAPFTGAALKPYAPAHMAVEDDGGDKVVTWVRRTRIGGEALFGTTPPLGEATEAYVGQILDANDAVIRTFSGLTSPTFTYTAAMIAADGSPAGVTARAMQVSAVVGNGYPADAAL